MATPGPSRYPIPPAPAPAPAPAPSSTANHAASTTSESDHILEQGIDVSVFGELAKTGLVELLNSIQGAKTLVLDPSLAGPLGLVTDVSLLKHQAVDKLFWLEEGPLSAPTKKVVWLCNPRRRYMGIIANQIKSHQADPSTTPHSYTIIFVPRCTAVCRGLLEEEGVIGDVQMLEYELEFMLLEEDVLSLEMTHVARDIFMNGDDTSLYYSSLALMTLQRAFGLFPRITGKGDAAKRLANLLSKHRQSDPLFSSLDLSTQMDGLIVLDRSVDWVTPMCTQLTYEGLIDEYIGIKNSHVEVDPSLLSTGQTQTQPATTGSSLTTPTPPKKKKHRLSSLSDRLFSEIRDLNFAVVGSRLSKAARRLEEGYEGRHQLKSVKEMKDFVGKLGGLQSEHQGLRLHTGLSEILMPITRSEEFNKTLEIQQNLVAGYDVSDQMTAIEDLLNQQAPMTTVLRAAVLLSLTAGGIRLKILENFKREFLQVYGYHHLPLLMALSDLDLLTKSPSRNNTFPALRKALRLLVDDVDEQKPTDISYTYSGYAPLSIRLVQCIAQKPVVMSNPVNTTDAIGHIVLPKAHPLVGWRGFEDVLKATPGAVFDETQTTENAVEAGSARPLRDATATTVIFFLGGCTYTEIAALRWMSSQTKGRRFLIATTGIINGSNLLTDFGLRDPIELKPTAA